MIFTNSPWISSKSQFCQSALSCKHTVNQSTIYINILLTRQLNALMEAPVLYTYLKVNLTKFFFIFREEECAMEWHSHKLLIIATVGPKLLWEALSITTKQQIWILLALCQTIRKTTHFITAGQKFIFHTAMEYFTKALVKLLLITNKQSFTFEVWITLLHILNTWIKNTTYLMLRKWCFREHQLEQWQL